MNKLPSFKNYPFHIDPLPVDEGGGFVIRFPDLPGCISDGKTPAEAIKNGREAFNAWMATQIEDGLDIPKPYDQSAPAKFLQRLPRHIHAQLVRRAAVEGVSMNTLVTTFIVEGLAVREVKQRFKTVTSNRII